MFFRQKEASTQKSPEKGMTFWGIRRNSVPVTFKFEAGEGRVGGQRIREYHLRKVFIRLVNEFGFILTLMREIKGFK